MKIRKPTLVILAAGMGSRYGGLKQLDVFTEEEDTIIDFALYDAVRVGFKKIVFVIQKSFENHFKKRFDSKLNGKVEIVYVYQDFSALLESHTKIKRTKPWGTGHALLMAKDVVEGNFAVINADDFYGKEAFEVMIKFLNEQDAESHNFSLVAYTLKNTISKHGYVSRGECIVNENGYVSKVIERAHIVDIDGSLKYKDENGDFISIHEDTTVSMNFWGFTPACFTYAEKMFRNFLKTSDKDLDSEFYMPSIVNEMLTKGIANVKVLKSDSKWYGVTYNKDKAVVKNALETMKLNNVYPNKLW